MELYLLFSIEEIDVAYKEATGAVSSTRVLIEMTIPSVLDKIISPPGRPFSFASHSSSCVNLLLWHI
jgi:hypothetical protein